MISVAVLITLMYVNVSFVQNLTPNAHNGSSHITVYMNILP